jgi:hypothetical protein
MRSVLIVLLLLIGAAAAWWYFAPETLPDAVKPRLPRAIDPNPPLYKWKDAHGQWHITDQPPPDRPYEEVRIDPRTNVVPTVVPGRTEAPED